MSTCWVYLWVLHELVWSMWLYLFCIVFVSLYSRVCASVCVSVCVFLGGCLENWWMALQLSQFALVFNFIQDGICVIRTFFTFFHLQITFKLLSVVVGGGPMISLLQCEHVYWCSFCSQIMHICKHILFTFCQCCCHVHCGDSCLMCNRCCVVN